MKEFTVGGRPGLQKAFAEALGVEIFEGYSTCFPYLYGDDDRDPETMKFLSQSAERQNTHYDLPTQWDEAMSYARKFYGMEKEEKPIEEQLSKMLGEDNARLRKAGCHMAEAAIRVINKYDGVHRLSLAVSEWTKAIADEGGRGEKSEPKEEKPPLPESESDLPPIELVAVAVPETASKEFWAFTKLYQLRQAYWNAHDGWRPDWKDADQFKYCIKYIDEKPIMDTAWGVRQFLAFPTLKQAKHFLKHHASLIEQARELL